MTIALIIYLVSIVVSFWGATQFDPAANKLGCFVPVLNTGLSILVILITGAVWWGYITENFEE